MGLHDEARAEAERRWPVAPEGDWMTSAGGWRGAFQAGAEWQASRKVDFSTKPHCSCLTSFDGEGDGKCEVHSIKASRTVESTIEEREELGRIVAEQAYVRMDIADAILEAGYRKVEAAVWEECTDALSRSQPVQVEVTDEMVEAACRVLLPIQPGVPFWTWARSNGNRPVDEVRAALSAALGGEPTEHKITQRMPWPPSPESRHMLSQFECSCGWTGGVFTDTRDNYTAIKNCRQIAEAHAAALGGGDL